MVTVEKVNEIVSNRGDGISEVKINPKGYVEARLANLVNENRPHMLVLHPIQEGSIFRIWVAPIARLRRDGHIFVSFARLNEVLRCGCVAVDEDGDVMFQINYLCDEDDGQPSVDLIERMLDETAKAVRCIERVVLVESMAEAGVPKSRAEQMVRDMLDKDRSEDGAHDEITL
jgi:hypothetical protein